MAVSLIILYGFYMNVFMIQSQNLQFYIQVTSQSVLDLSTPNYVSVLIIYPPKNNRLFFTSHFHQDYPSNSLQTPPCLKLPA
jgi:hypothetical protein